MAARLTPRRLHCGARVTRLRVARDGVRAVEYESGGRQQTIEPAAVANTLPITLLVRMLEPAPPEAVLAAARRLRFRDLTLVALFLDQPRVSDAACTYLPQRELPFTRAHEPRNRSGAMSPPGKTSLVVEFPCFEGDAIWRQSDRALVSGLVRDLDAMGLVRADRIEASAVIRHRKAYPVYSTDYRHLSGRVLEHLERIPNLVTLGRGGAFFYGHVHDIVAAGFRAAPLLATMAQGGATAAGWVVPEVASLDDSIQIASGGVPGLEM
jgi:protoporphyrinogen oxidase